MKKTLRFGQSGGWIQGVILGNSSIPFSGRLRVPGSEGREGPKGRKKNEAVLQNRTGIKKENKKRVPGYPGPGALVWE